MAPVRTRTKTTPEDAVAALSKERVRLAGERNELQRELGAAEVVIGAAPDRRQAALVDAARGRSDTAAEVQAEAEAAGAVVRDLAPRIAALLTAEAEVGEETRAVLDSDAGLAWQKRVAADASQRAIELRAPAFAAVDAFGAAWKQARERNEDVRRSQRRRGEERVAEVPLPDIQPPLSHMYLHYWPAPGGRRPEAAA